MCVKICHCGGAHMDVPSNHQGPITCGEDHCVAGDDPFSEEVITSVEGKLAGERSRTTIKGGRIEDITVDPTTGLQSDYVVLPKAERTNGFVRPVRQEYKHLKCGSVTRMGLALAQTYAKTPDYYNGTYCVVCQGHFPVGPKGEFVWKDTEERVGT